MKFVRAPRNKVTHIVKQQFQAGVVAYCGLAIVNIRNPLKGEPLCSHCKRGLENQ